MVFNAMLSTAVVLIAGCGAQDLVASGAVAFGSAGGASGASFNIDSPAYGFFIGGSSLAALNGVYGPRLEASDAVGEHIRPYIGHGVYRHDSGSGWVLAHLRTEDGGAEWCFVDPSSRGGACETRAPSLPFLNRRTRRGIRRGHGRLSVRIPPATDRFGHPGAALVPGWGTSWAHLHRAPRVRTAALDGPCPDGPCPDSFTAGGDSFTAGALVGGDDLDELPWQVAPIPHAAYFEQIVAAARRHEPQPYSQPEPESQP